MDAKKSQKIPLLRVFGAVEENTWVFEVLLPFLSLKRGTDLCCLPFPTCSRHFFVTGASQNSSYLTRYKTMIYNKRVANIRLYF